MRWLIVIYVVNAVLGALLYLDVVRRGRSPLWLWAFLFLGYPAMAAYVVIRRRERVALRPASSLPPR